MGVAKSRTVHLREQETWRKRNKLVKINPTILPCQRNKLEESSRQKKHRNWSPVTIKQIQFWSTAIQTSCVWNKSKITNNNNNKIEKVWWQFKEEEERKKKTQTLGDRFEWSLILSRKFWHFIPSYKMSFESFICSFLTIQTKTKLK